MSFWSDVVKDVSGFILAGQGDQAAQVQAAGQAAGAAGAVTSAWGGAITAAEGIWTELTDVRMWRSLGWLVLGIVLMLLGVLWWIGPAGARRSPAAVARGVIA